MDISVEPVRRDNLVYHGDLLIDPGNARLYKRASQADLAALLMPQSSAAGPKDETASYYEAQLIHYGLSRTKDKARAKLRLIEALNAGRLVVPDDIKKAEASLKREYNAAIKKAKADRVPANAAKDTAPQDSKRKRASSDAKSSTTTTTTKRTTTVKSTTTRTTSSTSTSTKAPKNTKPANSTTATPPKKATQPAKKPKTSETNQMNTDRPENAIAPPRGRPLQTARRGGSSASKSTRPKTIETNQKDTNGPGKTTAKPRERPLQTARRGGPSASKSTRPKTIKRESSHEESQRLPLDTSPDYEIEPLLITGEWIIDCDSGYSYGPAGYDERSMTLKYVSGPKGDSDVVWGSYEFVSSEGVFKAVPECWGSDGELCLSLEWRGRETGMGEMSFGEDCTGNLSIYPDGTLRGTFEAMCDDAAAEFTGQRASMSAEICDRTLKSFEDEFQSYNKAAYEYERVARWR